MEAATVIDWHAHWIPPEVTALFEARTSPPCIRRNAAEARVFHADETTILPLKEHQLDIGHRLAEMDAAGIGRQVLSLAVLYGMGLDRLPAALEGAVVTAYNDGLARLVQECGRRFSGLAALPVHDLTQAPAILERAMTEGLLGAVLPAEAFADRPMAERYAPLFATASRLGAHLFIHPGAWRSPHDPAPDDEAAIVRRRAVRFQNDLTAAALTFEHTGFLDPYPGATVHLANLGGTLALLAERIALTADRMGLTPEHSDGRLRRILIDSASFGPGGLALAVANLGSGRLLLGSDSPALPLAPAIAAVTAAAIGEDERRAILTGRAAKG